MSEHIDVGALLGATENALRNLIAEKLEGKFSAQWIENTGASAERLACWRERREEERKRLATGNLEPRLIYFADFPDIKTIIGKHWELFKEVFGEKREFDVLLSMLEDFRNPDAHRRGLLPFQKHLVAGICGQIRSRIVRFRSRLQTAEDCFPRIESAYDNHGQSFPGEGYWGRPVLRVGDHIEIVVIASDPEDLPLEYRFDLSTASTSSVFESGWKTEGTQAIEVTDRCIGDNVKLHFWIRSSRTYHAKGDCDDAKLFDYAVLPAR